MINELKPPLPTSRTYAPLGIINFISEEGKNISFNSLELAQYPDDLRVAFAESLVQCATVGYWLAITQRRQRDAARELEAYQGKLYHSLKVDGVYAEKYHGARPSEHGLEHAIVTDKTYIELAATHERLKEIADQLYNLNRLLERKHDVLKHLSYFLGANQRAEALEEKFRQESVRNHAPSRP
jgi:hypothetical protein